MTFTILSRAPLLALSIAVTLLASPLAGAQNEQGQDSQRGDRDRGRSIVTVAFGAGLNTAQPGNEQNHHIGPPPQVPPFAPVSLAQNRVEAVSFLKPGRYLVICAVLEHFNDGMYAIVEVRGNTDQR